jgi:hypothetical protein
MSSSAHDERVSPARPRAVATPDAAGAGTEPEIGERYFNRELWWLEFNRRVLHLAADPGVPLLERLKFVAIFDSNLDEFFMKRVGGLKQQLASHVRDLSPDGQTPRQQLKEIDAVVSGPGHAGVTNGLPAARNTGLAAHGGPGSRLGQRLPDHRGRQEGNPTQSRHGEGHRRPDYPGCYFPVHWSLRSVAIPLGGGYPSHRRRK